MVFYFREIEQSWPIRRQNFPFFIAVVVVVIMTKMLMFRVLDRRIFDHDVLFLFLEFLDVDIFVMQIVFIV